MAKKKTSSEKSILRNAVQQIPNREAASSESEVEKVATSASVVEPRLSIVPGRTAIPSPTELDDEIRRRAYDFYCERGGGHGSHEADWHRAESKVRSKYIL